jgi:flagellar hook-basal body complex protein FliE
MKKKQSQDFVGGSQDGYDQYMGQFKGSGIFYEPEKPKSFNPKEAGKALSGMVGAIGKIKDPAQQVRAFNETYKPAQQAMQQTLSDSYNPNRQTSSSSISNSFEKMGLGGIGSLGGRMEELEKASMRLKMFNTMQDRLSKSRR